MDEDPIFASSRMGRTLRRTSPRPGEDAGPGRPFFLPGDDPLTHSRIAMMRPADDTSLDGLILLDKPSGITSAKALYQIRAIARQRKSGHAGTLDPLATGVLILCLGKATRLVERLMGLTKSYHMIARLDWESDSHDSENPIRSVFAEKIPGRPETITALRSFVGEFSQAPPILSAIKLGGKASYQRAREGHPIAPRPRPVHIHRLDLESFVWPRIELDMTCGRGTYVRSLIRDLGSLLGAGGCVTELRRTAVGPFTVERAWALEDVRKNAEDVSRPWLIPFARAVEELSLA